MNQCVDCRFCNEMKTGFLGNIFICENKECSTVGTMVWCKDARNENGLCGIEGKHWEKKD